MTGGPSAFARQLSRGGTARADERQVVSVPNACAPGGVSSESVRTAVSPRTGALASPLNLTAAQAWPAGRCSTRLPSQVATVAAAPPPQRSPPKPPSAGTWSRSAAPQHFLLSLRERPEGGNVHGKNGILQFLL